MTERPVSTQYEPPAPRSNGWFNRFLAVVEWLGNLLPHPVSLFALFALAVVIISAIAAGFGLAVDDPRPGAEEGAQFVAISLLSGEGIRWMSQNLVTNFTGFVPLGTVLVALLGVGVAEKSGLLTAIIRGLVLAAPKQLVTLVIVFAGVVSNTASEMGYVVLIPLAMVVFHALGRHPFAGMAAAFAGVSGGYSANILIGTVDPLLAGITQEAAQIIDPEYLVHPAVNWYFMIISTFLITGMGWFVTAKIVEPRLGPYDQSEAEDDLEESPELSKLSDQEKRALKWTGLSVLLVVLGFLYVAGPRLLNLHTSGLPYYGVLRAYENPATGEVLTGPLSFRPMLNSVVPLIFIFFVVPGFVYGRFMGTMKNDRDVIHAMADAMRTMGLYIVLVFFAAQFVAFFRFSGLGQILAVVGADVLVALNLDNPAVFVPFILMCCFVNLMLGSASAQWAVTAPIFVPMLMQIGYAPEVIQAAYRIGDSTTNIITPMMSYFGLILAVATRYKKDLGIGTMVSTMLPYTIFFLIGWSILFYVWVFLLGYPVGPGSETYFTP
ncbi:MAG: AbgT family transporter [Phycisphaerales bacterium JB043]